MSEDKRARSLAGRVVSNRMEKTVAVLVERRVKHPLYKKYISRSTKLLAHDENNECGEGDTVYLVRSDDNLRDVLQKSDIYEKSGQHGFLIQEYVPNDNKALRVVKIGRQLISYWRIANSQKSFLANLSKGATIDFESEPNLRSNAEVTINRLCKITEINLAGFDVIFSGQKKERPPLLLEINYFFGRKGLGGSEAYYKILENEIRSWLDGL